MLAIRERAVSSIVPFVALAIGVRVVFWAATGRVWEDALISVAHARNLVEGLGLVHHPGEPPIHGFTSALSVLIPIPGELVEPGAGGIAVLRLASLIAVAAAILYADRIARRLGLSTPARVLVLAYLALDQNQIFYGMAGMETEVAVAILLASVWYVLEGDPREAGLSLGLALLARPDFVIWAVPALASLALRSRRDVAVGGLVAFAVVAPWLVFTTAYYGSPMPHTIVAKAAVLVALPASPVAWPGWALDQATIHLTTVGRSFAPFLEDTLALDAPVPNVVVWSIAVVAFVLAGIGVARTRRIPGWWPAVAFVLGFGAYRLLFLPTQYYDWYVPPFTAMAIFLVAAGIDGLADANRMRVAPRSWVRVALASILVVAFAVHLPFSVALEARIQREIEDGVRVPAARYLGRVVRPGDSVTAEAAGYLGYESRVKLVDYPGLTSGISLAVIDGLPRPQRTLTSLIDRLRPPWIVLRDPEQATFAAQVPVTAALYRACARFSAPGIGDRIAWSGYTKLTVDASLVVLTTGPCPD